MSVVRLAHSQCTHTLGTKKEENNYLQVCLSNFVWPAFAILVYLDSDAAPRREHTPLPLSHSKMPIPPHLRVPTPLSSALKHDHPKKNREKQQDYQHCLPVFVCFFLLLALLFALFLIRRLLRDDGDANAACSGSSFAHNPPHYIHS